MPVVRMGGATGAGFARAYLQAARFSRSSGLLDPEKAQHRASYGLCFRRKSPYERFGGVSYAGSQEIAACPGKLKESGGV